MDIDSVDVDSNDGGTAGNPPIWRIREFEDLSTADLYEILKLRVDVFVVEQACCYAELDDRDMEPATRHITGHIEGRLVSYARALPPQNWNGRPTVRIGRVVIAEEYRRRGLARQMMSLLLDDVERRWPCTDVFLSAQVPVAGLYAQAGFIRVSAEYLDDGIPHVGMLLSK